MPPAMTSRMRLRSSTGGLRVVGPVSYGSAADAASSTLGHSIGVLTAGAFDSAGAPDGSSCRDDASPENGARPGRVDGASEPAASQGPFSRRRPSWPRKATGWLLPTLSHAPAQLQASVTERRSAAGDGSGCPPATGVDATNGGSR